MNSSNIEGQLAWLIFCLRKWSDAGVLSPQETKNAVSAIKRARRAYEAGDHEALEEALDTLFRVLLVREGKCSQQQ